MKFILSLLIVLFFFCSNFAQDENQITETQAEEIYSDALALTSEGYVDQSIQKLQLLITNKYTDKYIYYSLFDDYLLKISQAQFLEKTDSKKMNDIMIEAKKYAGDALRLYPDDLKILYRYTDFVRSLGEYDEFYNSLQRILSLDKDDIFGNYFTGVYYFINKNYEKSMPYLQNVIANPKSDKEFDMMAIFNSYYYIGMIYMNFQNFRLAAQYMEKAKEINPSDYDLIKNLAFTYYEILDYNKAIANFKQIPEMFRSDEMINAYAGLMFITTNQELNQVVSNYQGGSPFVKSILFYQKGDYSNSVKQLDKYISDRKIADYYSLYIYYLDYTALKDNTHTVQQEFLIGNYAKEVEQFDIAIEYYKKVEENTNSIPDIYWLVGSLYDDKNDFTNAIYYYNKYIHNPSSNKFSVSAMVRLSYMYYKINDKTNSDFTITEAKKEAKTDQDLYQVYFYSGLMNMEIKNFVNAINDFEKALRSENTDSRLYYFLATSYYEMKNRKKAISYLETARNYDKENPEINNLLAYLYSLEGINLDEALRLVKLALIANPENYSYMDTMGWILFQKGDFTGSFEIFGKVINLISKEQAQIGFDEIYYHIGMIYEKMGNQDEAFQYYSIGLKINPDNDLLKEKVK